MKFFVTLHTESVAVKIVVGAGHEAIDAAREVFSLSNKLIERDISWKLLKAFIGDLDQYHHDFSSETVSRIVEIKANLLNGTDAHFRASEKMYEWASLTAIHMKLYIKLFDDRAPRKVLTQQTLLGKILSSEITLMDSIQTDLAEISSSFESAGKSLSILRGADYHASEKLLQTVDQLSVWEELIFREIERIHAWQELNEENKTRFVNLDDTIYTARDLILRCEEYQKDFLLPNTCAL